MEKAREGDIHSYRLPDGISVLLAGKSLKCMWEESLGPRYSAAVAKLKHEVLSASSLFQR